MNTALSNVTVLDLSRILAGPWAGQVLADLGADVIKIEKPEGGDDTRSWGPPFLQNTDSQDTSRTDAAYYLCANRNKKSVTVDFTTPEGRALVQQLAAKADVVLENFKVGGLKAYGLDYESLKALNPRLVYCSITGFGQTGPYAARPGYDFLVQAMGGLMSITGRGAAEPGAGPQKAGVAVTDILTGLYAAIGILAALNHREHSGVGQHIDLSLLDVQVACLANQAMNYLVSGKAPERLGNAHPNIVPYQDFPHPRWLHDYCGGQRRPICAALRRNGPWRTRGRCQVLHQQDPGGEPRRTHRAAQRRDPNTVDGGLGWGAGNRGRTLRPHQRHRCRVCRPSGAGPPHEGRYAPSHQWLGVAGRESAATLRNTR